LIFSDIKENFKIDTKAITHPDYCVKLTYNALVHWPWIYKSKIKKPNRQQITLSKVQQW